MGPAIAPKRKGSPAAGLQADQASERAGAPYTTGPGRPHPLGATVHPGGVNFAFFSQHATGVELLLFDEHDDPEPVQRIALYPETNKTFHFWHVDVQGLGPGMHYALRVDGPWSLHDGPPVQSQQGADRPLRQGKHQQPVGSRRRMRPGRQPRAVDAQRRARHRRLRLGGRSAAASADERDRRLRDARRRLHRVIRVRACRIRAPSAAVIEKIPYLKSLGVTAVELLPVFEFDETEVIRIGPDGKPLFNFWGYSTVSFFAPHRAYCKSPDGRHAHHRVPRHGEGAAQGRNRGHPRRGLQPHDRGQPRRAQRSTSRGSTTASTTTPSRTTGSTTWTTRGAATR